MGVILANDVMIDIGLALLEPLVNTQVNPGGPAIVPGIQNVTPGSILGIFVNALLVVGANGNPAQEVVTVVSVTGTTFTASFANAHPNTEPIRCVTFASGQLQTNAQLSSRLFSQTEVLGYMTDAQNDFCLKVRPVYAVGTVNITAGKKVYPAPSDSIRVERASIVNAAATPPTAVELYDATQTDLDLLQYAWGTSASGGPTSWYQDQINTQTIGFGPPPQVGNPVTVFYSQCPTGTLGLLSTFLIPDPMTIAVKWRTLAVCYSKDGEMRDPKKSAFAQQFYDMLCEISKKFMSGVDARTKNKEETVEPALTKGF